MRRAKSHVTDGVTYWIATLKPWARDGYRRGWITEFEVILLDDDGHEARLRRPGRWPRWRREDPDDGSEDSTDEDNIVDLEVARMMSVKP